MSSEHPHCTDVPPKVTMSRPSRDTVTLASLHPSPARTTASTSASVASSRTTATNNYATARFRCAPVPPKQAPPNHFYRVHIMHGDTSKKNASPPKAANVRKTSLGQRSEKELNRELVLALQTPQPPMYIESPPTFVLTPSERVQPNIGGGSSGRSGLLPAIPPIGCLAHTPRPPQRPGRSPQDVYFSLPPLVPTVPTHSAIKALSSLPSVGNTQHSRHSPSSSDDDLCMQTPGVTSSGVTSSLERRMSRLTQGQLDATKKAAARVLQMMFSINVSKTSRCVAMFQALPQNLVARSLFQRCRGGKRNIRKEEFYHLLRRVASDCQQQVSGSNVGSMSLGAAVKADDQDDDDILAQSTFMRRPSNAVLIPTASEDDDGGGAASFPPSVGLQSRSRGGVSSTVSPTALVTAAAKLHREDTDPIFALFDPEDTGLVSIRQLRDRFFSVALATKSDVLHKLIRLVFANTTYHTLESTISRFELQMMAQLLHEVLVSEDGAIDRALKRMHERDRDVLVLYEVSHPRFPNSDDGHAHSKAHDPSKLSELRAAVYQSVAERRARMQEMLDAVSVFPDQLNQTTRGCVTIRELRALCDAARYDVFGTEVLEPSQETAWKRISRRIVVRQHRYDDAFLTLASYIHLSQPPVFAELPMRAGLVAKAAAFISGGRMRHGSQDESVFDSDVNGGGGVQGKRASGASESDYDPILSEAVEDQERIVKQQKAAAKRQHMSAAVVASLSSRRSSNASTRRGDVVDVPSSTFAGSSDMHADAFRRGSSKHAATEGVADDSPLRGVGSKSKSFARHHESPVTSSPSPLGEEHRSFFDDPPEHGNPTYESRLGVVYKRSAAHPAGKPVHHH